MIRNIKIFHLLSVLERKHGIFELDPACRAILEIMTLREVEGLETCAEDFISGSQMSRATVYRKIRLLKSNGSLAEAWSNRRLLYSVGDNVKQFCEELSLTAAQGLPS
jgi:hypothetical protein